MQFTLKEPKLKIFSEEILECTVTTEMLKPVMGRMGYLTWEHITQLDHLLFTAGWMRMYRWRYLSDGDLYTTYIIPI